MTIFAQIFFGSVLLGVCSLIHIVLLVGAIKLLRAMSPAEIGQARRPLQLMKLLVVGFFIVLLAHTIQVWLWAGSFMFLGTFSNFSDAIYLGIISISNIVLIRFRMTRTINRFKKCHS